MKFFITFFFIFLHLTSFGQSQKEKDSVIILDIINTSLNEQDSIIQLKIFKKALSTSKKLKSDFGIYTSYRKIGNWKALKHNTDSTINEYKKGLKDLSNNSSYNFYFLMQIGDKFKNKSNYDSAVYYYRKSIGFGQKVFKKDLIVRGHVSLGNLWLQKREYDKSFKNYVRADSICNSDKTLKTSILRAQITNYLGFNARVTDGYEKALKYYLKAKKIYQNLNNEGGVQEVNIAIAQAYISMEKYNSALKLLNESVTYHAKYAPKKNSYSYAIIVRGFLLANMENYKEAEKDYKLYYNLAVKEKNELYERIGLGYLADFYMKSNQLDKSETYYKRAIKKCEKTGDLEREFELTGSLIDLSKKQKKFKKTVELYGKYVLLNEKIQEKNTVLKTKNLEIKYQTEKKEQEIALLTSQNKLAERQKKSQRNLLLGGITLTSIAGIFLFFLYRNRQKTTKKLQNLDIAKSNFFSNISHEFRTPLTLISGPIQQQLNKKNLSNDERSNFEMVNRNTNRLLSLVDQLLDISKVESGNLKLQITTSKIIPFIGAIADSFSFKTKNKNIDYKINIEPTTIDTWFDKDVLEKIITNLISNAVKYTPESGIVECNAIIKDNKLHFTIKNSGKGMTKEQLEKVFNRFYQISEDNKGTGIGLALVKELVTLHKGTITVQSTPNNRTTFTVKLPIIKKAFKDSEITSDTKSANILEKQEINTIQNSDIDNTSINEDNPILLIVDDNADIRTYVSSIFNETHTILQAQNGQEGIDIAIEQVPDIIISDIMMPIKNGIELCNTLKTDERTSHIPIILLTAKAGEENEIEGVKTGADDYITKPFNNELLKLKVEKLLENIKKLQERYSQEVILKPTEISINSADDLFLNRLQNVLDDKLVESTFNTEDFCKSIDMSRMQLHRKLKALFNMTTSEFIRSQRLKLAADLLKTSDVNVSQVGYSVGFNDPAYFSKRFKEVYNCTPTQYAKKG